MRVQKRKSEKLYLRVSPEVKRDYQNYCDRNGYSISKRIRLFIENELNSEKKEMV